MAAKIHNKDFVIIISGRCKGETGFIKKIDYSNKMVFIEGVNLVFKHQKSVPERNQLGGILKKEAPIHISNIALFNKEIKKADKVFFKFFKKKRQRFFKLTKTLVE
ncbi:50S ribosomal protein L24 [Buchnera aphidicola]|uniref:50S ribosomal protein L24 n=1 Tax=Buchnera aphidicola TaxID=9 RepID=UPI0031B6ED63